MALPILVVDDDVDLREVLTLALEAEGYAVEAAPDGVRALEAVRRLHPAVILLDMRMPVMDGWDFCTALRREDPSPPPIIVMTAAVDPARIAAEVKADAWLPKPFGYSALLRLVRRLAGSPHDERSDKSQSC